MTAILAPCADEGADGMVLSEGDGPLPVFSTTQIHADAVNAWMTGKARA